jgi:hypothetical protein
LISCPIDFDKNLPRSVSLTTNRCDKAANNIKIIDNQPANGVKKEFGVCVKQLTYPNRDFIIRFIEWVHILRILGAGKIHFYNRFVHHELMGIIKYFQEKNFVEMIDFLEPSEISNQYLTSFTTKVAENAVVNDCFYRTKNLYEYIAILDPDEVIMPLKDEHRSWLDLLSVANTSYDVLMNQMIHYPNFGGRNFDNIPEYHYILQHTKVR